MSDLVVVDKQSGESSNNSSSSHHAKLTRSFSGVSPSARFPRSVSVPQSFLGAKPRDYISEDEDDGEEEDEDALSRYQDADDSNDVPSNKESRVDKKPKKITVKKFLPWLNQEIARDHSSPNLGLKVPRQRCPSSHRLSSFDESIESLARESQNLTIKRRVASSSAASAIVIQRNSAKIALNIPEILHEILRQVDLNNSVPFEAPPSRRKPMSLRHALIIYGDTVQAREVWEKSQREDSQANQASTRNSSGLFNCLQVSRLWHSVSKEILYKKLHFRNEQRWLQFASTVATCSNPPPTKSRVLVLHKLTQATQSQIESIADSIGGRLQWLEFYTCASLVPTESLVRGQCLTKVVLPGCPGVSDEIVKMLAAHSPNLEHLDLRACDSVSDRGLKAIGKYCRQLRLLNVGRTNNRGAITYRGLRHVIRRTKVNTLGLAGCHVEDKVLWEIAAYRGKEIERLSLNNCTMLTNESVPRILGYTRNLSVLEIRGCIRITDMRPIVRFKKYREYCGCPPLIEGCEIIEQRLKDAETLMEFERTQQVYRDIQEWIHSPDDDVPQSIEQPQPISVSA